MFVFEADLVCVWGLATGATQLKLALIDPSLVSRSVFHVLWCVHLCVELELLHETWVWFADGPSLPYVGQGFGRADVVLLHQVSDDNGSGSRFAHGTREETVVGIVV